MSTRNGIFIINKDLINRFKSRPLNGDGIVIRFLTLFFNFDARSNPIIPPRECPIIVISSTSDSIFARLDEISFIQFF